MASGPRPGAGGLARPACAHDRELGSICPDGIRCCQAHRQSPILGSVKSTPEVRVLPSADVTRPRQYYDPVRHPPEPPSCDDVEAATLTQNGAPPITRLTLATCRADDPNGPERMQSSVASPLHPAFPVIQAGRRPSLHFRGLLRLYSRYGLPDRATAKRWPLSRGFGPPDYPIGPLVRYQDLPATPRAEPPSTGEPRSWGTLNKMG